MIRRLAGIGLVLAIGVSIATAEEFTASIKKVEDGKVTFAKRSKEKDKKSEDMTLPVADNVKVVKGKFNFKEKKVEAGEALEGGLKNERFAKIGEKGVLARIITDADNKKITEIQVFEFGGFDKKKKKKDSK